MAQKKIILKLKECLPCAYTHKIVNKEKKGEATILELSNIGLMMIAKEFLRPGKIVNITIAFPQGPFTLSAEIETSRLEWYVDDKHKDMYFTTRLSFKSISTKERATIMHHIYKCKAERRKAKLKRFGL